MNWIFAWQQQSCKSEKRASQFLMTIPICVLILDIMHMCLCAVRSFCTVRVRVHSVLQSFCVCYD